MGIISELKELVNSPS